MLARVRGLSLCLVLVVGCGSEPTSDSLSPAEAKSLAAQGSGKEDNSWQAKLCLMKGQPVDCDFCAAWGWYGESTNGPDPTKCEKFCPQPDPDCATATCVQNGNSCCQGASCRTLNLVCPVDATASYTCDASCVPQGTCVYTSQEVTVTVVGNGIQGFEVKVDNVSIGKDGTAPDPLDGKLTFKVKGNASHNIWVTDGYYVYQSNGFFFAGRSYTITMNPLPPPGPEVDVTIVADWSGYDVKVDGVLIGTEGVAPDKADKKFSFKVKGDLTHEIDVWDGMFNYKKSIYFKKGESKTIYVNKASLGPGPDPTPVTDCDTAMGCPGGGKCGADFTCQGGLCPGKLCSDF